MLLAALANSSPAQTAKGDADGDGRITEKDARVALGMSVGREVARPDRADMDGDGRVTSTDAAIILRLALGGGPGTVPQPAEAGAPAPSVIGLKADEAKSKFPPGIVVEFKSGTRPVEDPAQQNLVIAQDPPAGTRIPPGGKVVLTINPPAKKPDEAIVVPNVMRLDKGEAHNRMPDGLVVRLKETSDKPATQDQAGRVRSQSPPAGSRVARGTIVEIEYYGEYEPEPEPEPAPEPSAEVWGAFTDDDFEQGDEKGLRIRVGLTAKECSGSEGLVSAFFLTQGGAYLRDRDGRLATDSGNVSVWQTYRPDEDYDLVEEIPLFMPYSQLHLADGARYELVVEVQFHVKVNGQFRHLATSDRVPFTVDLRPPGPTAEIKSVRAEHNVERGGKIGLLIHIAFDVENAKGREGRVTSYFEYSGGRKLEDRDDDYATKNGQVATWEDFTLRYDASTWEDFPLFMPYSQLDLVEPEDYSLQFSLQVKVKTGADWTLLASSEPVSFTYKKAPSGPRAEIQAVSADHNVMVGGRKGMRIRTTFTVHESRGLDATAAAYFCFSGGTKLILKDDAYCDASGWICTFTKLDLTYDHAVFTDLELFMPYSELHLEEGLFHNLEFRIYVEAKIGGTWTGLAKSDPVVFTIDKRSSTPACSGTCAPGGANQCSCAKWGACEKQSCRSDGPTAAVGCTGTCAPAGENSCSCKAWGQCGKDTCTKTDPLAGLKTALQDLDDAVDDDDSGTRKSGCQPGASSWGHCRQGDMTIFHCLCSSVGACGNRDCRGK
ncbi:MAG: PASTA domain-containing protein [Planctomycetes bacterium]|nr:PASTA domain-containing protein [Planctomycetota bacterium]